MGLYANAPSNHYNVYTNILISIRLCDIHDRNAIMNVISFNRCPKRESVTASMHGKRVLRVGL